jgi:hypothetical protein
MFFHNLLVQDGDENAEKQEYYEAISIVDLCLYGCLLLFVGFIALRNLFNSHPRKFYLVQFYALVIALISSKMFNQ